MGNPLVPEPRVNKLGHVVTKHVRVSEGMPSASTDIPSPVAFSEQSVHSWRQRVTDIAESLFGAYARGMDFSDFDRYEYSGKLWARLAKFSPATLDRIETTRPNGKRVLASVILGHHTEKTVNDFLAVIGVMESEGMTERDVNAYLTSLTKYAGLVPQERGGSYPEERGEQCRTLVRVMRHMEHVSEQPPHGFMRREGLAMEYPFIEDDELLGLLLYPDMDRESVVRVIMERDLYNVEAIREIVRNLHPSLLDGGL